MIYVSSGAYPEFTVSELFEELQGSSLSAIELSGGKYQPQLNSDLNERPSNFELAVHNYYPVPRQPFVFNLASNRKEIVQLSIEHARKAIDLCVQVGSPYYSFHAGFLIDPKPHELGAINNTGNLIPRASGMDTFIGNVRVVAEYAKGKNIQLMIENNVMSRGTQEKFGCNPLLFVDPDEAQLICQSLPENVSILCDFAHLKVSAMTLGFPPGEFVEVVSEFIAGAHLSENDGFEDTNDNFTEEAWFFKYLPKNLDYYSIEVYRPKLSVLEGCKEVLQGYLTDGA